MNYRIFKYTLDVQQRQFLNCPDDVRFHAVGEQNGHPVVWGVVQCDDDGKPVRPSRNRIIRGVTTGEHFNAEGLTYIGTVTLEGWFVFHIFEQPSVGEADPRDKSVAEDYHAIIGRRMAEGLTA